MNKKLIRAIKSALYTPKPAGKNDFLINLPYPKATNLEIGLSQIGYIRKRFWCCSVLLLIGMSLFSYTTQQGKEMVGVLSAFLPLLTLTGITEINKSVSYHMAELELSCKYNLGKILFIRFTIIGVFHFIILLLLLIIFKGQSQYGLVRYAVYAVTPFLLTSYLSFWAANHIKTQDTIYICGGVTAFVMIAVFTINLNITSIYTDKYTLFWGIAFIAITALLMKEIYYLMNERNEKWNFA